MFYFIVNRKGGSGRASQIWHIIRKTLREKRVDFKAYLTNHEGHASKLAAMINSLPDDDIRLIIVGGDGTINEVLNGLTDMSRIRMGVIPTGSGNDFINGLGLQETPDIAIERLLKSTETRPIDIGEITAPGMSPRKFGISCGIGLDAIVCKKALASKQKRFLNRMGAGDKTYVLLTLETLASMDYIKAKIIYADGVVAEYPKLIFLAGMNLPYEGGGVPMSPNASPDDGMLSLCIADSIGKVKAFTDLPLLVKAKHGGVKGFHFRDTEAFDISLDKPEVVHVDGEYYGDIDSLHVRCIPKCLNIMI